LSLRRRLLLALAGLAVVLVTVDAIALKAVHRFLVQRVDKQLAAAAPTLSVALRVRPSGTIEPGVPTAGTSGPVGASPSSSTATSSGSATREPGVQRLDNLLSDYFIEIHGPNGVTRVPGALTSNSAPTPKIDAAWLDDAPPIGERPNLYTTSSENGPNYRIAVTTLPAGRGTMVVGSSLRDTEHAYSDVRLSVELASIALLAALALVGWWLLRHGVRPLVQVAATADAIAAGDLSHRVTPTRYSAEATRMGEAFNTMVDRVQNLLDEREESEQRLRRFVADASHELRTPLTAIRGYAELLRNGVLVSPSDRSDALRRLEQESVRMTRLVDDLLFLARLDRRRPLIRRAVDLTVIARDAAHDASAVEPDRPIDVSVPPTLVIDGDEDRLRQAVGNLLANVRAHTPRETPVHVRVREEPGWAVIEVADEGPGMTAEVMAHVFERFYRADPSRAQGGTGLGLAIVAAVANVHGGSAGVDSTPKKGACFYIRLPLRAHAAESARPSDRFDLPDDTPTSQPTESTGIALDVSAGASSP